MASQASPIPVCLEIPLSLIHDLIAERSQEAQSAILFMGTLKQDPEMGCLSSEALIWSCLVLRSQSISHRSNLGNRGLTTWGGVGRGLRKVETEFFSTVH